MTQLPPDDVSIGEHGGHIKGTPIAWASVVLMCAGFIVGGFGLIGATPWLFFVGMGAVFVGAVVSWATHSMSNVTARVERRPAAGLGVAVPDSSDEPARG